MIFEQAIYSLPEILVGKNYIKQSYESGIVSAFCMAVTQQVNGRNGLNPMSFIHAEKPYDNNSFKDENDRNPVYLRADAYLKLDMLLVASKDLKKYGWKNYNWLEAKFYRQTLIPSKSINLGNTIADILRITVLPPLVPIVVNGTRDPSKMHYSGRYFLHVYESKYDEYYNLYRNVNHQREQRNWIKSLITPGNQTLVLETGNEANSVKKMYGNIPVGLNLHLTNIVIKAPLGESAPYLIVLTRINSGKVIWNSKSVVISGDSRIKGSSISHYDQLRYAVAHSINNISDFEKDPPVEPEINISNDEVIGLT